MGQNDNPDQQNASAKAGKRLRLSIVDFNASFVKFTGQKAGADTKLLDSFQKCRIDDYTQVNTIFFTSDDGKGNANPPDWANFAPGAFRNETIRTDYLTALIKEMHARQCQVMVGYTLDEGTQPSTTEGTAFNAWLARAQTPQLIAHAQQIVKFFTTHKLDIDGINFDLEIHKLGDDSAHAGNLKTLIVETAKELASKRPGASVSYDNATFIQADGKPGFSWFQVQPYAIAKNAPNLIARPMHRLDKTKAQKSEIAKSISIAFDTGPNGGGITADKLQIMIDWTHASDLEDICKTVLFPNKVGLVIYNLGMFSRSKPAPTAKDPNARQLVINQDSLKQLERLSTRLDAALNPVTAAPGKKGAPFQAPLPKDLP